MMRSQCVKIRHFQGVAMKNSMLKDRTEALLRERPVHMTYKRIYEETGIPEGWLKQFSRGSMRAPDVCRVEALYVFLAKKPLFE